MHQKRIGGRIANEILMMFRSGKKFSREVSIYDPIGADKDGETVSLFDVLESGDRERFGADLEHERLEHQRFVGSFPDQQNLLQPAQHHAGLHLPGKLDEQDRHQERSRVLRLRQRLLRIEAQGLRSPYEHGRSGRDGRFEQRGRYVLFADPHHFGRSQY